MSNHKCEGSALGDADGAAIRYPCPGTIGLSGRCSHEMEHWPLDTPLPAACQPAWELVAEDLRVRDAIGRRRYGRALTSDTPVDLLVYAYEEALDLVIYLRAEIEKRARQKSPT